MRRRLLVVGVLVLALSVAGAGCSALTGDGTPTNTPANGTASDTPATPTVTPSTPEPNTTATPEENTSESPGSGNDTTSNESEESLPKYAAMMDRILQSDDTNMSSLDLPGENSTTLHSGQIEIKSVELEPYGNESNNDTRFRVEYYNTEEGLNEIRVVALAYTHVMNKSLQNDETLSFDEVDIISYQNESSKTPAGRMKIEEAWSLYYTIGTWNGESYYQTITATASKYENGHFGPDPYDFKQRLNDLSPKNTTIIRVEEYGAMVFVDYVTQTPPKNTTGRTYEMAKIVEIYGSSVESGDFSQSNDVFNRHNTIGGLDLFMEERTLRQSGEHDLRTWHMYSHEDGMKLTSENMHQSERFDLITKEVQYEKDILED